MGIDFGRGRIIVNGKKPFEGNLLETVREN